MQDVASGATLTHVRPESGRQHDSSLAVGSPGQERYENMALNDRQRALYRRLVAARIWQFPGTMAQQEALFEDILRRVHGIRAGCQHSERSRRAVHLQAESHGCPSDYGNPHGRGGWRFRHQQHKVWPQGSTSGGKVRGDRRHVNPPADRQARAHLRVRRGRWGPRPLPARRPVHSLGREHQSSD